MVHYSKTFTRHGVNLFKCGTCSSPFLSASCRDRHERWAHGKVGGGRQQLSLQANKSNGRKVLTTAPPTRSTTSASQLSKSKRLPSDVWEEASSSCVKAKEDSMMDHPQPGPSSSPTGSSTAPAATPERPGNRECRVCHKQFRRTSNMLDHLNITHLGMKFYCDLCPATYFSRNGFKRHLTAQHKVCLRKLKVEPRFENQNQQLPEAEEGTGAGGGTGSGEERGLESSAEAAATTTTTTTSPAEDNNMSSSSSSVPESEPATSSQFQEQSQPADSSSNEAEAGPDTFPCPYCFLKFQIFDSVRRHQEMVHRPRPEGQPPQDEAESGLGCYYPCPRQNCFMSFRSQESLQRHEAIVHQPPPSPPPKEKSKVPEEQPKRRRIKCNLCIRQFESVAGLRIHQTLAHDVRAAERKFGCEFCEKKFITKEVLREHRLTVHLGKRYVCPLCGSPFTHLNSLNDHMKTSCSKQK